MPRPTPTPPQSFLDIVKHCDNYRLSTRDSDQEQIVPWLLSPTPTSPAIGLLRPVVVDQLRKDDAAAPSAAWHFGHGFVSFAPGIDTPSARSRVLKQTLERWRDAGLFPDEIAPRKWRNELYPVYRNPFGRRDFPADDGDTGDDLNYALKMERAGSGLFGIVTFGIHMTVYEEGERDDGAMEYHIWVPRRAATKQKWPGYLDNSVAGGIEAKLGVFDCVIKESMEEASIPEEMVRRYARSVGTVSYFFRTESGWLQPEIEYIYDLRIPRVDGVGAFQPKPLDGEVESFELLPLSEVIPHIRSGVFKYNCAPVLIDFMIRKGVITPDSEPDYQEIVTRLHGRFDHERWTAQ